MEDIRKGTPSPTARRTPTKVRVKRDGNSMGDFLLPIERPVRDCSALGFSIGNLKPSTPKGKKNESTRRRTQSMDKFEIASDFAVDQGNKSNSASSQELSNFLYSLWSNQQLCDIIIKVNGKEYLAHKLALAAHSEKFTTRYCERQRLPASLSEINLLNSTAEALEEILNYIYTNQLKITDYNVDSLIGCATQLGVTAALSLCKQYLMNFNSRNVLVLMQIAEKHGFSDIVGRMEGSVFDNFKEICKLESFLNSRYDVVIRLLTKDSLKLKVPNELDIFFAIVAWIDYNRQERLQYAPHLLECVRFTNISPENLVKFVEPQRTIFTNLQCKEMLYSAFRTQALQHCPNSQLQPYSRPYSPKSPSPNKTRNVVSPAHTTYDVAAQNQSYSCRAVNQQQTSIKSDQEDANQIPASVDYIQQSTRRQVDGFHMKRQNQQTVQSNRTGPMPLPLPPRPSSIVVIGGINPFDPGSAYSSKLVEEFNPKINSWHLVSTLPDSRHHLGASMLDGYLYVVGGSILLPDEPNNLANPTDTCFRFSPTGNFWTRTASMRTARMYHGLATLEGVMYAVGGHDANGRSLDSVEYYNPDTDAWGMTDSMSEAKIGVATIGYHGLLYAVGGFYESPTEKIVLDTVECYDPRTNCWTMKQPLPYPCCHGNLVIVEDQLYLVGGSNMEESSSAVSSLSSVHRYNQATDTWIHVTDMPVPRHDAGAAVIGSKIYIVGGVSSQEACVLSDVECFDIHSLMWSECEPLAYPALGLACCSYKLEERA